MYFIFDVLIGAEDKIYVLRSFCQFLTELQNFVFLLPFELFCKMPAFCFWIQDKTEATLLLHLEMKLQ